MTFHGIFDAFGAAQPLGEALSYKHKTIRVGLHWPVFPWAFLTLTYEFRLGKFAQRLRLGYVCPRNLSH